MGKLDEYHFDYLDDDSRFADQINGALFRGGRMNSIQGWQRMRNLYQSSPW